MKKAITIMLAIALVAVFAFTLVACGDTGNGDNGGEGVGEGGTSQPGGQTTSQVRLENGDVVAEGTFDAGVTLSVSKIDSANDDYAAALKKVEGKQYDEDKVAVYDLSLVKNGAKVQPSEKVKITMSAPFATEIGYATYHIDGETAEELATTYANGKISFETVGFSYFVIVGKIDENSPAYTLVDKDGKEDANGDYVLFGSYPQSEVKDDAVKSALAEKAGDLPRNGNNGKWTSYKYPYGVGDYDNRTTSDEMDFMWYIDVGHDGETYRGVYFTYYRPNVAMTTLQDDSASYIYGYQKSNGYVIGNLYWFKHEPILWQIIRREDGKAQLLCMRAIDSQAYTIVSKRSENRIEDALDSHYVYYNVMDGVPQNTFATDYEYSAIRGWLNGSFYRNAFNAKQKKLVSETLLDNRTGEVGKNTTDKVFVPSIAELAGVKGLGKKASDYAKSQGVSTSSTRIYCDGWYTRDVYYYLRFNKNPLTYNSDRYDQLCVVKEGGLNAESPGFSGVIATTGGVVPSLWIML